MISSTKTAADVKNTSACAARSDSDGVSDGSTVELVEAGGVAGVGDASEDTPKKVANGGRVTFSE